MVLGEAFPQRLSLLDQNGVIAGPGPITRRFAQAEVTRASNAAIMDQLIGQCFVNRRL